METHTYFVPGWASWPSMFSYPFPTYSRGYAGPITTFPSTCHTLIIHSFGLHFVPKQLLQRATKVVLVGCFHSLEAQKRMLVAMRKRGARDPKKVLEDFYSQAGYTSGLTKSVEELDCALLWQDLQAMEESVWTPVTLKECVLLHGKNDRIVPQQLGDELHRLLPEASFILLEGDHFSILEEARCKQFF